MGQVLEGYLRVGGTSIDGASWSAWATWAEEPVYWLHDCADYPK